MLAGGLPQYDVYSTADGRSVTLGAIEPKFFLNFLDRVGRLDLAHHADPEHVRAELRAIFCQRTLQEWVDYLAKVDTCFAPVNTLEETLNDPQVEALGLLTTVEHARLGSLKQLAPPFALSATPAAVRRPPPELGQHTGEVLAELGLAADEISALVEKKVV
jgi:crotonobetainyl-CoA:carnitine CoA-transferase CaiB-like acyl-CoA transferase